MSRSHDSLNPETSARAPSERDKRIGHSREGRRLTHVLLGLLLVLGVLAAQGCHKIFGDYTIAAQVAAGECVAGTHRCVDEFLVSCDDGAWGNAEPCLTADRCDSSAGGCRVCEPGTGRCNEAWREVCSEDGTTWEPTEECRSAETCDSLACLCPKDPSANCDPCPEGEVRCQASDAANPLAMTDVLARCQGGVWEVLDTCANEVLCQRSVDTAMSDPGNFHDACVDPGCEVAGELSCDGNILRRCAQSLQMWNQVDVCETAEVCALIVANTTDPNVAATLTECVAPCSPAGSFRCDGQRVLQCNQQQTAEEEILTCPDNESCDIETGGCRRCTPGEFRCNAASLETCDDSYEWVLVEECATRALCSVSTDDASGAMQGQCLDPSCDPGDFACEGATLLHCNADRTALVVDEECGSSTLCNDTDGRCDPPVCAVDGSLECTADNTLRRCVDGRSRWETVEECPVGTTCSNDPSLPEPCLTECPAMPYQCVGNVRRVCNDDTGVAIWTVERTCNTPELCQCALPTNSNCTAFNTDRTCGEPVCGANLDDFNCNGQWLQACDTGRHQWVDQMDCGSEDLCSADGDDGACLACPTAGEVQCYNDGNARRTCSADRSEWVNSQNCPYDCVEGGSMDYCAVCSEGELRCGTDGDLDVCASDRQSLEDEQNCPFTCVNNGDADFCALCAEGESRCTGPATLAHCSDDLTELENPETCAYSCVDDGLNDFCGTCQDGMEQCNGDDLESCSDGVWGGGMECMVACINDPDGSDFCAPDCDPETFTPTCDGDTVQVCNDDGELVETVCGSSTPDCIVVGATARCAACDPEEDANTCTDSDTVRECSSAGTFTNRNCTVAEPACVDDIGSEADCFECDPDEYPACDDDVLQECSSGGVLSETDCGATNQECTGTPGSAVCSCTDGETQCAGTTAYQTCDDGQWDPAVSCPADTTCTTDACACTNGARRCVADILEECVGGDWDAVSPACPNGCMGDIPTAACEPTGTGGTTTTGTGGTTTTGTGGTTTTGTGGTTTTGTGGMGGTGGSGGMGGMSGTGGMGGAAGGSAG